MAGFVEAAIADRSAPSVRGGVKAETFYDRSAVSRGLAIRWEHRKSACGIGPAFLVRILLFD